MPGLKRSSEELLPLSRPAKVPRTIVRRPNGEQPSPSQYEGLASRWATLGTQAMLLLKDTIGALRVVFGSPEGKPHTEEDAAPEVYLASPPPSKPSSPKLKPAPPPAPAPVASSSRLSLDMQAKQPLRRDRSDAEVSTSSAASIQPQYWPKEAKRIDTGLPSPPSSRLTSTSSTSFVGMYPDLAEKLDAAHAKEEAAATRKRKQQMKHRQHIYHNQFKREVQEERNKTRDEMEQELYELRRRQGMRVDLKEFRGWLAYKERLEMLERREALSPSPSLVDLRRANALGQTNRRHSLPEQASPAFLEKALRDAKISLGSPRPPPPFAPSLEQLRVQQRGKDKAIEDRLHPKPQPLPTSLPPEDEEEVDRLLHKRGTVAKCVREQVSDKDLVRLRPGQWLNDEIINFYGQLIQCRAEESKENPGDGSGSRKRPLNAHYFSTFFWTKLKDAGYEKGRLSKWTKKFDVFAKDVILIPVNHNNAHWTGAVINFRKKRIESYDSMGMERQNVFQLLRKYLDAEHRDKKKKPFDFTGWVDHTMPDTPQQENGYDCGVFTCQFLESLSRGEEIFNFTQADMPYLRRRMVWEIGHSQLRDDP